jgi:hypothetical protein
MIRRFDLKRFTNISVLPQDGGAEWLCKAEDSVDFLKANARSDEIAIYAIGPAVLIHGVLAPAANVSPPNAKELMADFPQTDGGWRIQRSYGGGHGHQVYLEPPLSSFRGASWDGGEQLVFRRTFHGVQDGPTPVELSQKLVHSLDLHFVPERNAYCRLDRNGDIEDVIRIIEFESTDLADGVVVTILAAEIAKYMALTGTALVFRFDFTRFQPGGFNGWGDHERQERRAPDLFYNMGAVGNASYVNGFMVVRPTITVEELIEEFRKETDGVPREYATFKIFDWKNNAQVETSCAPEFLSNYFVKSDLPYEISPAFFRPEVLHRFKADPEKFNFEDRSISSRAGWHLKTYDINDAGQVHTYIGYLADLPIDEQRYWQSFNEWPKGPISKRAYENDFLGEWSSEYDPLHAIKHKIRELDTQAPAWWKPRGDKLANAARYPATDSPAEWANEIMAFDQLLVEGFLVKPLRVLAENAGRKLDPAWGSLKVLQECMAGLGQNEEETEAIVAPLRALHALRTPLKGHGAVSDRQRIEKAARQEFGTFRAHYRALAAKCDVALGRIRAILEAP